MRVRLLGSAAGGGFPQWNCNCANCRLARTNPAAAQPRTQSSIAISSDGRRWFLINASPDIRVQIESFRPLWPPSDVVRGTAISGVLLTNADLDHVLGLLLLRENGPVAVHASDAVRQSLVDSLHIDGILGAYGGIDWRRPPRRLTALEYADGTASGIEYYAFAVPGKSPRYQSSASAAADCAAGYRFVDGTTGGSLVCIPDLAAVGETVASEAATSDMLLLDGTFFDDSEMQQTGLSALSASDMGHLYVGGSGGSLEKVAGMARGICIYVHINNTNPMLLQHSTQRAQVEAAGVLIGYDGMEFSL